MRRRLLCLALLVWSPARRAEACTCHDDGGAWTFEELAVEAEAVAIVEVVGQHERPPSRLDRRDRVAGLEVLVIAAVKGSPEGATFRVWDGDFGTSCTKSLWTYPRGTVLAVMRHRANPAWISQSSVQPEPRDYVVHACREYLKRVTSKAAGIEFAQGLRERLAQRR